MTKVEELEERIRRLERSRTILAIVGFAALVAVAVLAGVESTRTAFTEDQVRARGFTLVDRFGDERASLRMGVSDEPRLELTSEDGMTRVLLGTGPQGQSILALRAPEAGAARASVEAFTDGRVRVATRAPDGDRVATLTGTAEGDGGLSLFGGGTRRGTLLVSEGSVGLNLTDAAGETRSRVVVDADGEVDTLGPAGP